MADLRFSKGGSKIVRVPLIYGHYTSFWSKNGPKSYIRLAKGGSFAPLGPPLHPPLAYIVYVLTLDHDHAIGVAQRPHSVRKEYWCGTPHPLHHLHMHCHLCGPDSCRWQLDQRMGKGAPLGSGLWRLCQLSLSRACLWIPPTN